VHGLHVSQDDGGAGSEYSLCTIATDCIDCGPRLGTPQFGNDHTPHPTFHVSPGKGIVGFAFNANDDGAGRLTFTEEACPISSPPPSPPYRQFAQSVSPPPYPPRPPSPSSPPPSSPPPLPPPAVHIAKLTVEGEGCLAMLYETPDFSGPAQTFGPGGEHVLTELRGSVRLVPRPSHLPTWDEAFDSTIGSDNATYFPYESCRVHCCDDMVDNFLQRLHTVREDAIFHRDAEAANR
jgi:hypothetical protein